MILIELTYKAPLERIDEHLKGHVAFLEANYAKGNFVFSGRKNPRTGGLILTTLNSLAEAEAIAKEDPFFTHQLADYHFIDFTPSKWHPDFAPFTKT